MHNTRTDLPTSCRRYQNLIAETVYAKKKSLSAPASLTGCSKANECPHSSKISALSTFSASLRIPSLTVGPKNSGAPTVMIGNVSLPPFSSNYL